MDQNGSITRSIYMGLCEHFGEMCHGMCVFLFFFWILLYSFGIRPPKITWFTTTSDRTIALFCKADPTQKQNRGFARNREELLGDAPWPGDALPSARCQKPRRCPILPWGYWQHHDSSWFGRAMDDSWAKLQLTSLMTGFCRISID